MKNQHHGIGVLVRSVLLVLLVLVLASCEDSVTGNLNVNEGLNFNGERHNKDIFVERGNHSATAVYQQFGDRKKLVLKVKRAHRDGYKNIVFKISDNVRLPRNNGQMFIPAYENGQDYDLVGNIKTNIKNGSVQYSSESCSWTTYRTRCRTVCNNTYSKEDDDSILTETELGRRPGNDRDLKPRQPKKPKQPRKPRPTPKPRRPICRQVCREVPVTHYGYKNVSYHYVHKTKNFRFRLIEQGDDKAAAVFKGSKENSQMVYGHRGVCR